MIGMGRLLTITMLLVVSGLGATAAAQEAPVPAASEPVQLAQAGSDETNRAYLREFLGRDQIQQVARVAGVDMDDAMAGVMAMDSDRLSSAAQQARVIDQQITAQDRITLKVTTIIIVLLVLIIVLIVA